VTGLAEILHGALLHAAAAAWSSVLDDIPELRGRLTASAAYSGPVLVAADPPDRTMTPTEAVRWFQQKRLLPREQYDNLSADLKAAAFTLAGDVSHRVLLRVHESTLEALEKGQSFSEWKNGLGDFFDREGFTPVNGYHLRTVFDNAMLNSYSVQRYHGLVAAAELRPWWRYMTVGDDHVREAHRKWHGKVFHYRSGFWFRNYPLNGHRCRCYVVSLSDAQLEAQGIKPLRKWDGGPAAKGWDYNPALARPAKQIDRIYRFSKDIPLLGWKKFNLKSGLRSPIPRSPLAPPITELKRGKLRRHLSRQAGRPDRRSAR